MNWFGRIVYTREGIDYEREFKTEAEARAYALGVNDFIAHVDPDHEFTEDYIGDASNVEAVEE